MQNTEEIKGITIVSLVVTIVVLLILAGVTVSVLFGNNGVVDNVKERQDSAYSKIAHEEVKKLTMEYDVANSGETLEEFLIDKVQEGRIEEVTRKDDKTLIVKKNGYEIEVESENRIFIIEAEPYVGTYDGKSHDVLTSVSVSPSDAKIKYSIDNGKTYKEEMPTVINATSVPFTVKVSKTGYKTETITRTAIVNKAEGKITLSATSGTITYPDSTTFRVSGNTGNLSVSSNSTNIATASLSGSTITVKSGTTAGKAIITVTSAAATNYNAKSATYIATVNNGTISLSATPYTGTYDGKAHNAITSVTVNPSDAKIDYSTDGTNYSTTMPTVTNSSSFTVTVRASKAGYKTQTTTQTVKVNKAEGKLTLSATSGTLTYPTSTSFTVSGNTGTLSVSSNNTNIATVSVSGSTITVKPGTTAGKATITVTSVATTNYNAKSATYTATVQNGTISLIATPYTGTYDGKEHNAFTSVNVTPSDAKLEYSINGGTYSTTMPTITNTSSFTVTVKASKAGYKTQIKTETVRVNKAAGTLTLSATSGTLTYPTSTTFTASGNKGTLSVASSNTNIATASISGNTVTVKPGTTAGKATITVTSAATTNYNEKSATYTATVNNGTISLSATPYTGTYDGKAHNAITKVTVTPSDSKIEYSTDGKTYSTTMPTITNTSSFTVTVRASKAGYKTQSTTQTVKVNKAAGTITLSATSGTIMYPSTSTTFTVSGNTGTLSVSSSNTSVATVSINGNTVTVKSGSTVGTATITVKSAASTNYNEKTATYTVTISNGYVNANTKKTYSDGDVWLPEGFRISKDSASTVKGGIVIEDKDLNQFVWVPVATIADYKRTWYIGDNSFDDYSEALPEDEKTSVKTYKGFYIGRYEAGDKESTVAKTLRSSNDVTKTVTIKANQVPYNAVTRTQAKSLAEGFKTQQGYKAKTKLVSSYAWDTTIAFLQKVNSDYGSSSKEGNYTNTTFSYTDITGARQTKARYSKVLVPTGQTTPVCNIYDMGGNVWEWTTESFSYPMYPYVLRGGGYGSSVDYSSR